MLSVVLLYVLRLLLNLHSHTNTITLPILRHTICIKCFDPKDHHLFFIFFMNKALKWKENLAVLCRSSKNLSRRA